LSLLRQTKAYEWELQAQVKSRAVGNVAVPDIVSEHAHTNSSNYKMLFPVDFSNRSISAVEHVSLWRRQFGASLETVHVVDNQRYESRYDHSIYSELSRVVARRTADLEYFCLHQFGKDVAHAIVLAGSRADQLEHLVNREQIDLIMLPRNHQSFISKFFGDSIAAILLERCTASVWMTEHLEEHHAVTVNNVLCAMHFKEGPTLDAQNFRILEMVRQLVINFGAEVTFLQVTGDAESGESGSAAGTETGSQLWMAQARDLLGSSKKLLRRPSKVIPGIRETADEIGADLVVVGRMRPEAISFGRQSLILKIDHAVRCPVLSVW
jgi:nucleotide-binding universal stress UspA family protein